MNNKFIVLITLVLTISFLSTPNVVFGNGNEVTYGKCEITISMNNVGFENRSYATNYCEPVIWGYFAAGYFHLSGAYSGSVEYSGQQFQVSNPFSPNVSETITVHLVDHNGKEIGDYIRVSGKSRIYTAIEVSKLAWPTGLQHPHEKAVILARSDNPADALAASSLVGKKWASLLLTNSAKMEQPVIDELKRLKTEKIYLLGGTAAISNDIQSKLIKMGYQVERIAGSNRFETAAKISAKVGSTKGNRAIIVNGYTMADALSASASAARGSTPIYLTTENKLPVDLPKTVKNVDIYGGTSVISEKLSSQLESKGITVNRIAGANRYATSVASAKHYSEEYYNIILVRGTSTSSTKQDFPDAVVASNLAGRFGARIVLVHPTDSKEEVKEFLESQTGRVYVLGGEGAISSSVLAELGLE